MGRKLVDHRGSWGLVRIITSISRFSPCALCRNVSPGCSYNVPVAAIDRGHMQIDLLRSDADISFMH